VVHVSGPKTEETKWYLNDHSWIVLVLLNSLATSTKNNIGHYDTRSCSMPTPVLDYTISEHRPKNEVSRVSLESPIESLPPCCFMKSSYEWNACFSTHSEKWSANIFISQWLITVRPLDKETEKETEKTSKMLTTLQKGGKIYQWLWDKKLLKPEWREWKKSHMPFGGWSNTWTQSWSNKQPLYVVQEIDPPIFHLHPMPVSVGW
jgi:hypothetical protein